MLDLGGLAAELVGNVLGRRGERGLERDEILPGTFDEARELLLLLAELVDERRDLGADLLQRAIDALAGLQQRSTLAGKLTEQTTDAMFVLAVGAFECGHLAVHERFELA